MQNYFVGIDNGGSVTKAVVFDAAGREVACAAERVPVIHSHPGFTERDMEALWRVNVDVIRDVVAASAVDPRRIAGIACTGHGKGMYLWGTDDRPAANGIVSTDTRAWAYPDEWKRNGVSAAAFPKIMQTPLACQPAALWRWFQDNAPEVLQRVRWLFSVKDYIRFRLTGEAWAEMTDYSGSGLMNLAETRSDRELLNVFGIADVYDRLPPLCGSTALCGTVTKEAARLTGLMAGTPVAAGMFDIDACAVAMDVTDETNLCVVAGTWGINEYVSRKPELDGSIHMNSLFCVPGYYLVEESSPTSVSNNDWFIDVFLESEKTLAQQRGVSLHALAEELAASVGMDEPPILFLPFLYGSNDNPRARACFLGLESSHSRPHLIRAVLEGVVFSHRVHVERLLAGRSRPEAVRLAGGAVNNRAWCQIFADVLGLPIETVDTRELGALGAAMAAAVATGGYPDLKAAARAMVRIADRLEPDLDKKPAYDKKFGLFMAASAALDGLWKRF